MGLITYWPLDVPEVRKPTSAEMAERHACTSRSDARDVRDQMLAKALGPRSCLASDEPLAAREGSGRAPQAQLQGGRMSRLGSERHRALIDGVVNFYAADDRVKSIGVFGSVAAGTWHELSDVDLDVVV